ncbi:glycoside hydrolase family 18 protein [Paramuribaculum intestinale]|uniref:glycoside hydrolase family 18 protein n=1 Tax=Paramuribaculum intestinale TaxID=2094151 RepID=UPI0025B6CCEE|nr:glycosyl hydrolase family 18 protein [Paramuribaculum intestinale]
MKKLQKAAVVTAAVMSVAAVFSGCNHTSSATQDNAADPTSQIVVAYVTGWSSCAPDPSLMTHINYAFGKVAPTFDSVTVQNPARLDSVVALHRVNPDLKIMLSIGGWGAGNFSEMAADSALRAKFADDCLAKVERYGLDGIDIDWEYPTSSSAGISSSPEDTENYTLLMRQLRETLGPDRLLTLATIWSAKYIDFEAILPYVDFVNIMSYDMSPASSGRPHAPLYASEASGNHSADSAYRAHLAAGIPAEKLVLGLPFYGRGVDPYPDYMDYKDLKVLPGTVEIYDSIAETPYMADSISGRILMGFENQRSMAAKLHYIKQQGMLGAMYWEYCADNGDLAQQVADSILHK